MIATALAVAGVAGASAVYVLAQRQHSVDRQDVAAWEARAIDHLVRARAALGRLTVVIGRDNATLREIEAAASPVHGALKALRALPAAEVVEPTRDLFLEALDSVAAATDRAREGDLVGARRVFRDGLRLYALAREEFIDLRCRARIPSCKTIPRGA